jgi:glutaryl-CoA dehydrogenase (non-decarboxylating)
MSAPVVLDAPDAIAAVLTEYAAQLAAAGGVTADLIARIAATGVLGAMVPAVAGGRPLSHVEYGRLNHAVGAVSPALQSLFTVHGMVCRAVAGWAPAVTRAELLPRLATGELVGAFALSEEQAGSDVRAIGTTARETADGWALTGHKRWVSFGAAADVFLVFARSGHGDLAVLVRADDPGVEIRPGPTTSGFGDSQLAEIRLVDAPVPHQRMLGHPGTALSHVAADALILGRLCVAHGSAGLARAACDAALGRAIGRQQFGAPLHRLQLVRGLLADAVVETEAAELLCDRAARALDGNDEWTLSHVLTAKLAASRAASRAAAVAAQLYGADGLVEGSPVDRRVRDARVMEIIEGSTQLLQHLIAEQALARYRADAARRGAEDAEGGHGA